MTQGILLDTSVWICYLRPTGWEDVKESVRQALLEGHVYTCWVIKAELLIGTRDDRSYEQLKTSLEAMAEVPVTEETWASAAQMGYELRRQGLTVPLPDLLIAQVARQSSLLLWHVDKHLETLARRFDVATQSFLPSDEPVETG